ncbi:MAG: Lrp/AsnC family transcriptional regulator, partial [Candidatus Hodarchaeales archaeon]
MDEVDKYLLLALSENCRISYSEIAKTLDLSTNTIKNRVVKLEEQRIISGYLVELNPKLLNLSLALISFTFSSKITKEIEETIGANELIFAVGISVNSGFATANYKNNEELAS